LVAYFGGLKLVVPSISSVSVDGAGNSPGLDAHADQEVALDVEIAGAVAPGARIVVYFAPFTERGWVDGLAAAVGDKVNRPSVISISWGYAEGEPLDGFEWTEQAVQAVNETLQSAAAMGVSVCASSGDDGSNDRVNDGYAHVNFPASSPFVLGCGGTKLGAVNNKIVSEVAWNDGPGAAGGGGISAMNPLPKWQTGQVPRSVNPGKNTGRGVPDVCANASPSTGYRMVCGGKSWVVGGTSGAVPLWAALIARINKRVGRPIGFFNPLLYSKFGKSGGFRDIVAGSNDTTGRIGGYSAGPGWDACTGWGSPIGNALLSCFEEPQ
jgi:kumamolisin